MTSSLAPRWEWRVFGTEHGHTDARLATMPSTSVLATYTHIVGRWSDASTTIRDSRLDVKELREVNQHGLELWQGAAPLSFPLDGDALCLVFRAWGLTAPPAIGRIANAEALLRRIVTPHSSLAAVTVDKQGRDYAFGECLVEIAEVSCNGMTRRTAAVTSTDPAAAWRTIQTLGLSAYENVNDIKALKRFLTIDRARNAPAA
jgi:exopolyphosphatase / guanosine-5'-triphosphate,3'-diphosphate pyrophosphatase